MAFEINVDWMTSNFNGQPCIITLLHYGLPFNYQRRHHYFKFIRNMFNKIIKCNLCFKIMINAGHTLSMLFSFSLNTLRLV